MKTTEIVRFQLFRMPCCSQQLCWVNPRFPNYCPECGASVLSKLREDPSLTLFQDSNAQLKLAQR